MLYDCFQLDANVMRSTDHGKSRKVRDLQTFQDTVMTPVLQHSGIHTVSQLPSNLSSVGSSAPSAISCKSGISPKQGLVYLITVSSPILQEVEADCTYFCGWIHKVANRRLSFEARPHKETSFDKLTIKRIKSCSDLP